MPTSSCAAQTPPCTQSSAPDVTPARPSAPATTEHLLGERRNREPPAPSSHLLVYEGLRLFQSRHVFGPMDLRVRRNRFGYVAFLLGYQVLCSSAPLAGYAQHLAGARRRWK